jgi:hypothetical protein
MLLRGSAFSAFPVLDWQQARQSKRAIDQPRLVIACLFEGAAFRFELHPHFEHAFLWLYPWKFL